MANDQPIEHCRNESCLVCAQIGRGIAMMAGTPVQLIRQAVKNTMRGMEGQ